MVEPLKALDPRVYDPQPYNNGDISGLPVVISELGHEQLAYFSHPIKIEWNEDDTPRACKIDNDTFNIEVLGYGSVDLHDWKKKPVISLKIPPIEMKMRGFAQAWTELMETAILVTIASKFLEVYPADLVLAGLSSPDNNRQISNPDSETYGISSCFFSWIYKKLGPDKLMALYSRLAQAPLPDAPNPAVNVADKGPIDEKAVIKAAAELAQDDTAKLLADMQKKDVPAYGQVVKLEDGTEFYLCRIGRFDGDEKSSWYTMLTAVSSLLTLKKEFPGLVSGEDKIVIFDLINLEHNYHGLFVDKIKPRLEMEGLSDTNTIFINPIGMVLQNNDNDPVQVVLHGKNIAGKVRHEIFHLLDPHTRVNKAQNEGMAEMVSFEADFELLKRMYRENSDNTAMISRDQLESLLSGPVFTLSEALQETSGDASFDSAQLLDDFCREMNSL